MGESCDIVIGVSVELNNFQIEFSKQYLRSISVSAEDVSMQETEWEYLQIPVQTLVSSTHSRYGWIQYWQGPENKAEPPSYITYLCTTLSSNTKIRQSLIIKKLFIPVCLSLICSSCILAVNLMGILYLNNNFPRSFNKYFSVLKSNVESQDNIHSIVKSLNNFERMIRFWLNKTSEESYENEFDWKRKKLKDFLNQKWPPSFQYNLHIFVINYSVFIKR